MCYEISAGRQTSPKGTLVRCAAVKGSSVQGNWSIRNAALS